MAATKQTLKAMRTALNYIEDFGPDVPGQFEEDSMAKDAYDELKAAYDLERKRIARAKSKARTRVARRRGELEDFKAGPLS